MADDHPRARDQFLQLGGDLPDAVHAIVHEVHLAAAIEFLLDSRLDQFFVPARHHGLNGDAVLGGRFNYAHIAQPD